MSANFVQISGPSGRYPSFAASPNIQTFLFNPASLKGTLPGGDFMYLDRLRFRLTGFLTRKTGGTTFQNIPNWEAIAQCWGGVRVYSQFLGELVNKSINTVPIIANHDGFLHGGFAPITRARSQVSGSSGDVKAVEFEFEIAFRRKYLLRDTDSCPWLPFLEGGIIEIDLQPSNAAANYGWDMTGNWTAECVADWFPDRQPLIHTPIQPRLYRVVTVGPEYVLKGVGAPFGLDGVVQGARLAALSWLGKGKSNSGGAFDNGFYNTFGGGGILFGTNNLTRLDVPFRDQVSIDAVSAWLGSFLADTQAVRHFNDLQYNPNLQNDMAGWPYAMDPAISPATVSLINDALDFWPLVWPGKYDKISDMQKVDGDLSFTATLGTPPGGPVLHLFRTDEVCGWTPAKVLDLMDRMGLPHVSRGGQYDFGPKYAGAKKADDSTQWGMPIKVFRAA
jgi:hypothetical protein